MDNIVKAWGPLIDIAFCGSRIEPRWGETMSQITIKNGARMKMDLRLATPENTIDVATASFFPHNDYEEILQG